MKLRSAIFLLTILLLNCLGQTHGMMRAKAAAVPAILYVAPGGACLGMFPCYNTPQAAADAAPPGSVIRIAAGSYPVPAGQTQVLQITKSLLIQGGFRPTDWYDPQPITFPTVLDGQHLGRAVLINGNPAQPIEVTLEGVRLQNGQASQGAGISGTGVNLLMRRCIVSNNQASGSGGGIFLSNSSSLRLEASRVISNTSGDMGGGITLLSPTGNSSLYKSWVFGNHANSGGGGISLIGGQVNIETILLTDNAVTLPSATGAGLASDGTQLTLTHTTIARNTGGAGHGISMSGASLLTATDILIAGQVVGLFLAAPGTASVDGVLWGSGATWANGANTTGSVTVQHAYTGDPLFTGLDQAILKTYFHIGSSSPACNRSILTPVDYRDIDNEAVNASIADLGTDELGSSGTIHVDTEPGGDIEVGNMDGVPENSRGTIFWNGAAWVTNDTAAHMLFTDIQTQDRLKNYTMVADIDGSGPAEQIIGDYHVSRSTYAYIDPAQDGVYRIEAAQYRITKNGSQEIILLNSRGNGYGQASFDIYIQIAAGATIAFRSGSAWFNYAETPDLASQRSINDLTARAGSLTTCDLQATDRSRYWVDWDGGSDMGSLTYFFHTSSQPNRFNGLGICFPDEFRVKYMNATNALDEFRLRPVVYSETLLKTIYLPMLVR
jgi:parallel beta-helix repeat protein